jgi:hypothetical protein
MQLAVNEPMTQHIKTEAPTRNEQTEPEPAQPANEKEADEEEEDNDAKLDEAIEMTFPASDPISI